MNDLGWLIRREFWENRAIWIVPAAIGALLTLAALFGRIELVTLTSPEESRIAGSGALFGFGGVFFLVMSVYTTWYLLDSLYADRKDRSILFWKSLPISDTAAVLAKLLTGLIVIPLVYFVIADVATLLVAFIVSVRASSTFSRALWQGDLWLQLQAMWLYVIVTTAIWYLPFAAWLMVISAWAKRAVTLWAILPPLAVFLAEREFLGTHRFGDQIGDRVLGYLPRAFRDFANHEGWVTTVVDDRTIQAPSSIWALFDPVGFFSSPATWIGLVVGAGLVAGAIQLRMRRTEI